MTDPTSPDFFARLGLPQQFALEDEALRQAYFRLQQEYHPDRTGHDAAQKTQSAIMAANINEAYHALKNPLSRAQHLLHLQGVEVNGERDTVKPSQALLTEVMDWREKAEDPTMQAELKKKLDGIEKELSQAIADAFEKSQWQAAGECAMRWHYLQKTRAELKAEHAA